VPQGAVPAPAGLASPRAADGSPGHRQAVTRLPPRKKAVMTARKALLKCAGAGVMPGRGGSVLRAGKARRGKKLATQKRNRQNRL